MFKKFMDYSFVLLISISIFIQFLRLVYLLFKPNYMEKFKFFSEYTLSKYRLSLYYLLAIIAGCYVIWYRFK